MRATIFILIPQTVARRAERLQKPRASTFKSLIGLFLRNEQLATAKTPCGIAPGLWQAQNLAGPERNQRNSQLQHPPTRPHLHQRRADNPQARRRSLALQGGKAQDSPREGPPHGHRQAQGDQERPQPEEGPLDGALADPQAPAEEIPPRQEGRQAPLRKAVQDGEGELVQEQEGFGGVHFQGRRWAKESIM